MRTREQLALAGVLLLGLIVPDWFKMQSDGGSVPGGRVGKWLFKERQWRAVAFIHDYFYYLIALQWPPDSAQWVGARMEADYELKQNRKLCSKHKFIGWAWGRIIFRGVRVGGSTSVRLPDELVVPPTIKAIEDVERDCQLPLTEQAQQQIAKWKRMRNAEDIA